MNAFGIILVLLGVWIIVNALNGNLSGLIAHETTFTLPTEASSYEAAAQSS
jgi:hypothetical protein